MNDFYRNVTLWYHNQIKIICYPDYIPMWNVVVMESSTVFGNSPIGSVHWRAELLMNDISAMYGCSDVSNIRVIILAVVDNSILQPLTRLLHDGSIVIVPMSLLSPRTLILLAVEGELNMIISISSTPGKIVTPFVSNTVLKLNVIGERA